MNEKQSFTSKSRAWGVAAELRLFIVEGAIHCDQLGLTGLALEKPVPFQNRRAGA